MQEWMSPLSSRKAESRIWGAMSTSTSPSPLTETQRARIIHPDEENTQGPLTDMHKHMMGRFKEAETDFFSVAVQ